MRTLIEGATLWVGDELASGVFMEELGHPRILITGSRHWDDRKTIGRMLGTLPASAVIIQGGCRGADSIAYHEARLRGLRVVCMNADWDRYGNKAGPIRNSAMLKLGPDVVWAFHDDLDRSKGTLDMVRKACRKGIPVAVVGSS